MIFVSISIEKIIIPCSYRAPIVPSNLLHTCQFNLHLVNSLAVAVSEPALYRLLTFHVPNLRSLFRCLGRTKVSVQTRRFLCEHIVTRYVFIVRSCQHLAQPPSWRTTHCRLSATAYSIYSQLLSILEAVPPSATWGRAKSWWRGPTYHGDVRNMVILTD